MLTMSKLRHKTWYKLLKVLYFMLLLISIVTLLSCISKYGKDWHSRYLPETKQEALNDPKFYMISDEDKRDVLSLLDMEFNNLRYSDQKAVIAHINTRKLMEKPIITNYVYKAYYTWNSGKCVLYLITGSLICFIIFKAIKHIFYFIALGKFYP